MTPRRKERSTLHIFGGGELIATAEQIAIECGWSVVVRTGQRFISALPKLKATTKLFVGDELPKLMKEGGVPRRGDVGLSISAPWIISKSEIDSFKGRIFNLHQQALPRYRGAGGTSWLLLMNEKRGGCCIHRLVAKIDSGEILDRVDFEFPAKAKTPRDLDLYLAGVSRKLLKSWLKATLKTGSAGSPIKIDENLSEYWPRLNTDIHGWIDWKWSLTQVESFCHAFSDPHAGARTKLSSGGNVRLRSVKARIVPNRFHPFQTGLVFRKNKDGSLLIAHQDGILTVSDFVAESGSRIPRLGDRLFTPRALLDEALGRRIQYLPSGKLVEN